MFTLITKTVVKCFLHPLLNIVYTSFDLCIYPIRDLMTDTLQSENTVKHTHQSSGQPAVAVAPEEQ